jgi:D-aminoacyl-tRNA deacylase
MRAVIQRVKSACVKVKEETVGKIEKGLLVLLAIHKDDKDDAIIKIGEKILNLRIFSDGNDKMNLSLKDIAGQILLVSQFTLYGDARKGNRPSFTQSAGGEMAKQYYDKVINYLRDSGINVETGRFGAMMEVELVNDGPVTIILDA